jgi:hypothetical protein
MTTRAAFLPSNGRCPLRRPVNRRAAFGQARFYDFNVLTEKKKPEKLEYIPRSGRGVVGRTIRATNKGS